MTDEKVHAEKLANKILDTPYRDPDDDMSCLSRQFLRALEREASLRATLAERYAENARLRAALKAVRPFVEDARVAFLKGLETCREMMARFVEQGGDARTALSIRANWNPIWGQDPGVMDPDAYQQIQEQGFDPWI
jgi:hypothetical protein